MPDFSDEEPPTLPDRPFGCPKCVDALGVSTGLISGAVWDVSVGQSRSGMQPCDLCGGRKVVGRATLIRFEMQSTPPSKKP